MFSIIVCGLMLVYMGLFIHRQRRREKLRKAIKTEVTFRPNDSIIPQEVHTVQIV